MLACAAAAGFLGVALGAFGAHGLQPILEERGTTAIWQTAVHYWFYHTLALLAVGFASGLSPRLRFHTSLCWIPGMTIFSGSLFVLAAFGPRWLGAITPIGGLLLLAGWGILFFGILRKDYSQKA